MRSRLPIALFLFSILFGAVFYFGPWVNIVAQKRNGDFLRNLQGLPPLPPEGPDYAIGVQFWQDWPYLGCNPSDITGFESPADQNAYVTYLGAGQVIFGTLILCWVVFGFLNRRAPARLPLLFWTIIGITFICFEGAALFGHPPGCDTYYSLFVRQAALNWPTGIGALLALGTGLGALLISGRGLPGQSGALLGSKEEELFISHLRLPFAFFLFSLLIGGVSLMAPWGNIVGERNILIPAREGFNDPSLPPDGAVLNTTFRFWQNSLYFSGTNCPSVKTLFVLEEVQSAYETFLGYGRLIFGAQIVCWVIFGFLYRRVLARISLLYWMMISVAILCIIILSSGPALGCDYNAGLIIQQVHPNPLAVIGSLLSLATGVGAILTSRRSAREIPGERGNL